MDKSTLYGLIVRFCTLHPLIDLNVHIDDLALQTIAESDLVASRRQVAAAAVHLPDRHRRQSHLLREGRWGVQPDSFPYIRLGDR